MVVICDQRSSVVFSSGCLRVSCAVTLTAAHLGDV
jgi:hypothetical protein